MDSQTVRNKIFWSDETKIEQFGLNFNRHAWFAPDVKLRIEVWARIDYSFQSFSHVLAACVTQTIEVHIEIHIIH